MRACVRSLGFLVAAVGWALLVVDWMGLPVVDDAAISIAYGLSFWEGWGFRLTQNSGVVEGFTSPLWAIVTGCAGRLELELLAFAKWSGAVLGGLGLALLSLSQTLLERRGPRLPEMVALVASLAFPSLFFWLSSGMETGLHLFVMAVAYLLAESSRLRGELVGLWLACLVLVRPELVVVGAALMAWWCLRRLRVGQSHRALLGLVTFAGALAVLFTARRLYFLEWLPNTWFAKRGWDFNGAHYLGSFGLMHVWSFAGAGVASMVVLFTQLRGRLVSVLVIITAGLGFGLSSQGDWMREWRFLVWVLPFLVTPLLLSWIALRDAMITGRKRRLFGWLAVFLASGLTTWGSVLQVLRFRALKSAPEFPATFVMGNSVKLKKTLDDVGVLRPHLGLPDVGGLALVFRESDISDVAGLADYAMAHAPGTAAMEDYLVHEGPPLAIDAHGPSGHVAFKALKPWFAGWGRGLATLTGLTRDEDPRCPGRKAVLMSSPPDQLESRLARLIVERHPVEALRLWRCAETYLSQASRLSAAQCHSLGLMSQTHARALEVTDRRLALRYWSLATLLARNDPALRKRTEQLRAELFPGAAER